MSKFASSVVSFVLGSEGASVSDILDVCYALGGACAATGMVFAMHQSACAVRVTGRRISLEKNATIISYESVRGLYQ
jgi:hypothetical protein